MLMIREESPEREKQKKHTNRPATPGVGLVCFWGIGCTALGTARVV